MQNDYNVPNGYVLLETELIPTKTITGLMENFTASNMSTIVEAFFGYLIEGPQKFKVDSVRKLIAIGVLALPFMNTMIIRAKGKAKTILRANGFSLGLLLGTSVGLMFGDREKLYVDKNISLSKRVMRKLATAGFQQAMAKNRGLFMVMYAVVNKIFASILKMPQHDELLQEFVTNESLYDPKELASTFLKSLIVGVMGGFAGVYYILKMRDPNLTQVDLMDDYQQMPNDLSALGTASLNALSGIKGFKEALQAVKPKKSDSEYAKLALKAATGAKESVPNSKGVIATIIKSKVTHHYLAKYDHEIQDLIAVKVQQAIYVLTEKVKDFYKHIARVTIAIADHDNAYIHHYKGSKYEIVILVSAELKKSMWLKLSIQEIAAILAHEYGHFIGGAFRLMPIIILSKLAIDIATCAINDHLVFALSNAAKTYSIISVAKLAEIQADAFAVKVGLGKELASALKHLSNQDKIFDEFGALTTHGGGLSRSSAIEKYSKEYSKLKNKLKKA